MTRFNIEKHGKKCDEYCSIIFGHYEVKQTIFGRHLPLKRQLKTANTLLKHTKSCYYCMTTDTPCQLLLRTCEDALFTNDNAGAKRIQTHLEYCSDCTSIYWPLLYKKLQFREKDRWANIKRLNSKHPYSVTYRGYYKEEPMYATEIADRLFGE